MKLNYYTLLVICSIGILLQSCNKWLDIKPKLETEREELYSSEQGFKDALTGCYTKLKDKSLFGNTLTMSSLEYMAQHWDAGSANQDFRILNYKGEAVKGTFKDVYNNLYNTIAQANDMIYYLDLRGTEVIANKETFKLLKGEALAIRAFCHFELLRVFGQTPNNAKIYVDLPYAERASEGRVPAIDFDFYVEKLIRDFSAAERLLGESDPLLRYTYQELNDPMRLKLEGHTDFGDGFRRVRFNYWAVKALMARLYMYTGDKTNAYYYANEVLTAKVNGKSPISLLNSKNDIANEAYTLPSETLLALHMYDLETRIKGQFDGPNAYSAGRDRSTLLSTVFMNETSDLRYGLFIEQGSAGSSNIVTNKKYWQSKAGLGLVGNQSVKATDDFVTMQMVPIIRLGEVYLIAAESAPSITESNRLMQEYKANRNIQHKDYNRLIERTNDIANQYNVEFWAEGQMFYYYKRNKASFMKGGFKEVFEADYIVPLPDGEF